MNAAVRSPPRAQTCLFAFNSRWQQLTMTSAWLEFKWRLRQPLTAVALGACFVATAGFLLLGLTGSGSPDALRCVVLPLLISVVAFASGCLWMRNRGSGMEGVCPSCGYDLRGHAPNVQRCPECGEATAKPSHRGILVHVARFGPAAVLGLLGAFFGFAGLMCFALWSAGAFDR